MPVCPRPAVAAAVAAAAARPVPPVSRPSCGLAGRSRSAGPSRRVPSGAKREPCSGQSHVHSASFHESTPPRCVQTALTARVRPPVVETATGWPARCATTPSPSRAAARAPPSTPRRPIRSPPPADLRVLHRASGEVGRHGQARAEHQHPSVAVLQLRPADLGGEAQRRRGAVREPPLAVARGDADAPETAGHRPDEGHHVVRVVVLRRPPVGLLGAGEVPQRPRQISSRMPRSEPARPTG